MPPMNDDLLVKRAFCSSAGKKWKVGRKNIAQRRRRKRANMADRFLIKEE